MAELLSIGGRMANGDACDGITILVYEALSY